MQRLPIVIEDALIAWAQAVHSDAKPLWADQDGRRPAPPFMMLDVIAGPMPIGAAEERYKQADTYTYGIRMQATLNVQVTADNALVRAAALVAALEMPSYMLILQTAGIATHGAQALRDITSILDTGHQWRATVDIIISWPQPVDDTPGEIRKVHITGDIDEQSVDTTIDIEQ